MNIISRFRQYPTCFKLEDNDPFFSFLVHRYSRMQLAAVVVALYITYNIVAAAVIDVIVFALVIVAFDSDIKLFDIVGLSILFFFYE